MNLSVSRRNSPANKARSVWSAQSAVCSLHFSMTDFEQPKLMAYMAKLVKRKIA